MIEVALLLLGFLVGLYVFFLIDWDLSDEKQRVQLVQVTILPLVAISVVFVYTRLGLEIFKKGSGAQETVVDCFNFFSGGYDLALFVFAWWILNNWTEDPSKAYFEPLFVSVGVTLAVTEYFRQVVSSR